MSKISLKKIGLTLSIILGILLIIALLASIKYPWQQSFRVIFGSFYVLFLPGFIWSYVFFDGSKKTRKPVPSKVEGQENKKTEENEKPLDGIERMLLSFALSLALSPLLLFFLNIVGVKINLLSAFFVGLFVIIVGISIIMYKIFRIKAN